MFAITENKGIVKDFSDLVGERGHVGEGASEQSRADICGVVYDVAFFFIAIRVIARFEVVRVESENAALVGSAEV